MKDAITNSKTFLLNFNYTLMLYCSVFAYFIASTTQALSQNTPPPGNSSSDLVDKEAQPIAFSASYFGLLVDQNHPWSYGTQTWSKGGPSWGTEYRFFYKDNWTLAINGAFKQLVDQSGQDAPIFSISQETMRIFRVYHPWYLAAGARLSYFVPVRKVMLPYEKDQSRAIDTGAAVSIAAIWIASPRTLAMLTANRWRSLSTTKKQGIEITATALFKIR